MGFIKNQPSKGLENMHLKSMNLDKGETKPVRKAKV